MTNERKIITGPTNKNSEFRGVLGTDSEYEYKEFPREIQGVIVSGIEGWERVAQTDGELLFRRKKPGQTT